MFLLTQTETQGWIITCGMDDSGDFDADVGGAVEYGVVLHREDADVTTVEFGAGRSDAGVGCERGEFGDDQLDHAVGGIGVVVRDIVPDVSKILSYRVGTRS